MSLTSFTLDFGGSASSPFTSNLLVQSSVGGFGSANPTLNVTPNSLAIPGTSTQTFTGATVDVSGIDFTGLSSVTFQLRFFDNAGSQGDTNRIDNIVVNGTVAAVPEPHTYAMFVIGGLALLIAHRRRHRAR